MRARLVPVYFEPGRDAGFDDQVAALGRLLADDAELRAPVPLGAPLPDADAVVFPPLSAGTGKPSTMLTAGRRNHNRLEVNGSKGSVVFDLEDLNRLQYDNAGDPRDVPGFRSIQTTEGCHPYIDHGWPPGHAIGHQNTFVNQFADFFEAIVKDTKPEPGFEAGLANQRVLDAVSRSITAGGWVDLP